MKRKDPASIRQVAEALGLPRSTARDWIERPDFPRRREDGSWDREAIEAYAATRRPAEDTETAPEAGDGPDYYRERARKMRADADRAEHELALRRGELIPAGDVEASWSQNIGRLFAELDKGLTRAAPKLPKLAPAEILKELRNVVRAARENCAL